MHCFSVGAHADQPLARLLSKQTRTSLVQTQNWSGRMGRQTAAESCRTKWHQQSKKRWSLQFTQHHGTSTVFASTCHVFPSWNEVQSVNFFFVFLTVLSLKDRLSDVLAEAERGDGAVIPPRTWAVMRRCRQPLRHQQLHVERAVSHQQLMGFVLSSQ